MLEFDEFKKLLTFETQNSGICKNVEPDPLTLGFL